MQLLLKSFTWNFPLVIYWQVVSSPNNSHYLIKKWKLRELVNISCVLVPFPVTMTKYSDNSNLEEKEFIWLRILGYRTRELEVDRVSHSTPIIRNRQQWMQEWLHSFSIITECRILSREDCHWHWMNLGISMNRITIISVSKKKPKKQKSSAAS